MEILKTPTVQWGAATATQPGRKTPTLQWGAAEAPLPGQNESGDRFLVEPFHDGVLVAVVDALAHGHRAAQISPQTIDTLAMHPRNTVTALVQRCHDLLHDPHRAPTAHPSLDWPAR